MCVPCASVDVLPEVAEPEASATGEPKALPSTLNCTVPVGLDPVTLAVKLTAWPYDDGFRVDATDVLVLT